MSTGSVADDFYQAVEQYHRALGEFMKGDCEPARRLFSEREDVTLGNPFGPFARGLAQVTETMQRAASNYRDGGAAGFDTISKSPLILLTSSKSSAFSPRWAGVRMSQRCICGSRASSARKRAAGSSSIGTPIR